MALLLGGPALSTGCLVAEAPEYGEPQRTPPFIVTEQVDPPPYFVIEARRETETLTVPVRSEDAGEALHAVLWLDYGLATREHQQDQGVPPASFADGARNVSMSWRPDISSGCHTLTMLIMHYSNYDDVLDLPREGSGGDVASVTWFVNKLDSDVPAPTDNVLTNCPAPGSSTP